MSLATIGEPPDNDESFWIWATAHAAHHRAIADALQIKFSQAFNSYIMDPFPFNQNDESAQNAQDVWLEQHQAMHSDMNTALNIPQNDLTDLSFTDKVGVQQWFAWNYSEHLAADQALNIGG